MYLIFSKKVPHLLRLTMKIQLIVLAVGSWKFHLFTLYFTISLFFHDFSLISASLGISHWVALVTKERQFWFLRTLIILEIYATFLASSRYGSEEKLSIYNFCGIKMLKLSWWWLELMSFCGCRIQLEFLTTIVINWELRALRKVSRSLWVF